MFGELNKIFQNEINENLSQQSTNVRLFLSNSLTKRIKIWVQNILIWPCFGIFALDDYSKLKDFVDDSFKFDENGRKFSDWVDNTMEKGEIARYKQFLLFLQCF